MFRTFEKVNRPAYPSPRQFLSSWTASTEYIYIYIYIYTNSANLSSWAASAKVNSWDLSTKSNRCDGLKWFSLVQWLSLM
jgi:hypothetical protein